jgi:hypothetical protein
MTMVEYLDPEIANEGQSVNNWQPGAWTNAPATSDEEYQPDIEPPHIQDYAAFKKHKHYRQYFRAYRYVPFPAWMYHATQEPKLVKSKEEVAALGPEWSPTPLKPRIDMTGKSLPVKSETQRLAEVVATALAAKQGTAPIDATAIAAIVAAVMAALPQGTQQKPAEPDLESLMPPLDATADETIERKALLELAEKEGIKVDGRWSNQRIKKELGL